MKIINSLITNENHLQLQPYCISAIVQLLAYPHSAQQADVVGQHLLKNEEVTGCLLLMQLLHLVLHLCQLGQGPGQGCVVLRVTQHGHTFGKYCCVPTQLWFRRRKQKTFSVYFSHPKRTIWYKKKLGGHRQVKKVRCSSPFL